MNEGAPLTVIERRGRLYFLILAGLIILDEAFTIAQGFTGGLENLNVFRFVLIPSLMIVGAVSLWQGEPWIRWALAVRLVTKAGLSLLVIGLVMYSMIQATPPEQLNFFASMSRAFFGIPLLVLAVYMFAGLTLLFSPSLKAFCQHQQETAVNPWLLLSDRLWGNTRKHNASLIARQILHEPSQSAHEHHPPVLTRSKLDSLDDYALVDAVVDYVRRKIDGNYERAYEIVSSLPQGFQAVYSTWWVQAEVTNGGFHQYFFNKGVDWAFMALEGYKLFGATEQASVMAQAIDVYLQEEPDQLKYRTDNPLQMINRYMEAREASTLPQLDSLFYAVENANFAAAYIRAHSQEFVRS